MQIFSYQLFHATIRSATPIILAVLAAVISKQANIFNIAVEGIMLFGALIAIAVSLATGSWVIAVLAAILIGVVISAVIGIAHLKYKANILVLGFATNALALGGTRFIMQRLYGIVGAYAPPDAVPLPRYYLSFLSGNPVLESLFSGYTLLELLGFVFIFALWFVLYKTRTGLRLRSVGLNETAAETAGINVNRTKFFAILMSGVFGGIAGAHLSLGYTRMFVEGMSSGRGFMANAAMNFGGGNPVSAMLASLLFGFSESLGLRLQSTGLPGQFFLMTPYLVTIVVLTLSMMRQASVSKQEKIAELKKQKKDLNFSG